MDNVKVRGIVMVTVRARTLVIIAYSKAMIGARVGFRIRLRARVS